MAALALECVVRSDVGRRPNNEDAAFAGPRLAVVADGVGGQAAGETASRAAVDALIALDKSRLRGRLDEALTEAVEFGNQTIGFVAECRPQMAGMSTTLTAVALADDGTYVVAYVGDSRTYLFRDAALTPLTRDDSLVQELVDGGHITAAESRRHPHRSVVLRALDGGPGRRPAVSTVTARAGDRLLLCSDGLSDVLDDATIAAELAHPIGREVAQRLIELALAAGGRDNVSLVVADVVAADESAAGW